MSHSNSPLPMSPRGTRLVGVLSILLVVSSVVSAAEPEHPLEPVDTSSPQATLQSLLDTSNQIYQAIEGRNRSELREEEFRHLKRRLLRCLNLEDQPAYLRNHVGAEAAVCLKETFDRIALPPEVFVVGDPEEIPKRWRVPYTDITIALVKDGPRQGEYLFTPDTVDRASVFYEHVKHLPYRDVKTEGGPKTSPGFYNWFLSEPGSAWLSSVVRALPRSFETRIFGQAIWQWIGLLICVVGGFVVMVFAYLAGRRRAMKMRGSNVLQYCLTLVFPLAAMLVPLVVKRIILQELVISGATFAVVGFLANLIFLLAVCVFLTGAGTRIAAVIISSPKIHPRGVDAQFIRLACRVLSIVAAVIVFLEGGKFLGIPITTLLAGAGVGGLAVALGAQDTLKNLFGSMMIVLDKPYRVGERIVTKGYDGVVEEIGLRSTKIRLLTGHIASVPNDEMARCDIENVGRRKHIRHISDLAIPLDTPATQVELALTMVREIMAKHPGQEPELPPRVYLKEFARDCLVIRIIFWFHPPDYWEFVECNEALHLQIQRKFESADIPFALPATINYLETENSESVLNKKAKD